MMDQQAGELLVKYAAEISKRCVPSGVAPEAMTAAQSRAKDDAWRLLSHLQPVLENIKESDMFWELCDRAQRDGNVKEQERTYSIAKNEDRQWARNFASLETLLSEVFAEEKKDPLARKHAEQVAATTALRAKMREDKRLERNAMARDRNAAKKALAAIPANAAKT